jgi:hypothetical protein
MPNILSFRRFKINHINMLKYAFILERGVVANRKYNLLYKSVCTDNSRAVYVLYCMNVCTAVRLSQNVNTLQSHNLHSTESAAFYSGRIIPSGRKRKNCADDNGGQKENMRWFL